MPTEKSGQHIARLSKKDEFFTQFSDVEQEMKHYIPSFNGKTVYCNCDDPKKSSFVRYFRDGFQALRLKKLIATCWKNRKDGDGKAWHYELTTDGETLSELQGDGDFRSEECTALLDEADIVTTNPPFSLFRKYFAQLIAHEKRFLILGNQMAISYGIVFPLIKADRLRLGVSLSSGAVKFNVPDDYPLDATDCGVDENGKKFIKVKGIRWFTNLNYTNPKPFLQITKTYSPDAYPSYDNYEAIDVGKTKNIPKDYVGVMGVPITFLDKYNPDQFEIVGKKITPHIPNRAKGIYKRLLIRRKHR